MQNGKLRLPVQFGGILDFFTKRKFVNILNNILYKYLTYSIRLNKFGHFYMHILRTFWRYLKKFTSPVSEKAGNVILDLFTIYNMADPSHDILYPPSLDNDECIQLTILFAKVESEAGVKQIIESSMLANLFVLSSGFVIYAIFMERNVDVIIDNTKTTSKRIFEEHEPLAVLKALEDQDIMELLALRAASRLMSLDSEIVSVHENFLASVNSEVLKQTDKVIGEKTHIVNSILLNEESYEDAALRLQQKYLQKYPKLVEAQVAGATVICGICAGIYVGASAIQIARSLNRSPVRRAFEDVSLPASGDPGHATSIPLPPERFMPPANPVGANAPIDSLDIETLLDLEEWMSRSSKQKFTIRFCHALESEISRRSSPSANR